MSYITAIGTANPPHRFSQSTIADFMLQTMALHNGDSRKLKTIFKATGIDYRHSVLEDYGKTSGFTFYSQAENFEPIPSTEKRINIFRENAVGLSKAAVEQLVQRYPSTKLQEVTHLVVACCTGMYAPGLDIDLVKQLQLKSTVQRTAINFMGCYAAFNALKVADAFCKSDEQAKVLIVCTELCSLHFQRAATEDNILANALFGDGSAALFVEAKTESPLKLSLEKFHSDLSENGEEFMAWTVGDLGFEMKLSAYVPDIIRGGIKKLTLSLLSKISANLEDIKHFAIHPGGKKILQAIETELGLTRDQNSSAYKVLQQFGNMSSATVLFVLAEVVSKLSERNRGERILSFAFGPGLTLESMVLKIENV
jgi:alpha-pyrone synthase